MAGPRNNRSIDLPEALAAFFSPRLASAAENPAPSFRLCVALSGGRDSVALLHALAMLRERESCLVLSAIHVHHGLSPRAEQWVAFCEQLCASLDIPLTIVRAQVDSSSGEGLEGAARQARYAAFADCDVDYLALAHHRDDQAETLLLNLCRGAGVDGLACMPAERSLGPGQPTLLRPLLDLPRASIAAYLDANSLQWVEDESNDDVRLRRNFMRHEILPRLATVFPDVPAALARAAVHLQQASELANEIAAQDRARVVSANGRVMLPHFHALPPARQANLLRRELAATGVRMPDRRRLKEILRQLAEARGDAQPCLCVDGVALHMYRGELHLVPSVSAFPAALRWRGEAVLPWGTGEVRFEATVGRGVRRTRIDTGVATLRLRAGGERFQCAAATPRRALKKILSEAGLPPWERERLPLLYCDDVLVWVGGIGIDAGWQAAPGESGLLPVWVPTAG